MADAQNNNPQEIAHDRRNDKTFNVPQKKTGKDIVQSSSAQ
jgi:hypothetical protein